MWSDRQLRRLVGSNRRCWPMKRPGHRFVVGAYDVLDPEDRPGVVEFAVQRMPIAPQGGPDRGCRRCRSVPVKQAQRLLSGASMTRNGPTEGLVIAATYDEESFPQLLEAVVGGV